MTMPTDPRMPERALRRRTMSSVTCVSLRVLHINADEIAGGVGMLDEIADDGLGNTGRLRVSIS